MLLAWHDESTLVVTLTKALETMSTQNPTPLSKREHTIQNAKMRRRGRVGAVVSSTVECEANMQTEVVGSIPPYQG